MVKDKVIIGAQGGEWPYRGPIFGVDAKTGKQVWQFFTVGGNEGTPSRCSATPGATTPGRPAAAAAGWPAATIRRPTRCGGAPATRRRCTTGPATSGRPKARVRATNLYTTSVILLDPDTGKLKAYHQEMPHDAWDFDSSMGEFMMIEQGGKKYVVHPSKGGFVFVYDRKGKVQNVYRGVDNINFVKDINPKTGELIGRRDLAEGKHKNLCPAIAGGYSWNSGSYNPKTGLFYRVG